MTDDVQEREGRNKQIKKTEILTYTDKHKEEWSYDIPFLHCVKLRLYTYKKILTFRNNGLY